VCTSGLRGAAYWLRHEVMMMTSLDGDLLSVLVKVSPVLYVFRFLASRGPGAIHTPWAVHPPYPFNSPFPHLLLCLLVSPFPFPFFTCVINFLAFPSLPILPEQSYSVSRPDIVGGD